MAGPNIVYLPGIFGSRIGLPALAGYQPADVWISPASPLLRWLIQLQLGPDGVSPGPLTAGIPLSPLGLLEYEYGPLRDFMVRRGWQVLEAPYDWRLSVQVSSQAVLTLIRQAFGSNPIVFVAHSMGGLVARAVYALLALSGFDAQVQGIVTMGTPHWGSWEVVRGFHGLPELYRSIQWAIGMGIRPVGARRLDYLDDLLASWPGWYELAPWRDAGPLASADPLTAQALYQTATYADGNPYVSQTWLNAAVNTQHYLAAAVPPNRLRCIRGRGFDTANELVQGVSLSRPDGYVYAGDGDGQVPKDYALAGTLQPVDRTVNHGRLPLDPRVWDAVEWAVQGFVGQGA